MKRKKRLAVFDIDGTIFRSSLLIELVEELIHARIFRPGVAAEYERDKQRWLDRKGSYESYIDGVVRAFRKNLKGIRNADFLRATREVVSAHQSRVYRFTRDLAADLKKRGYYLVAISHSPRTIVGPFAERMGFDKIYGLMYEVDEKEKFDGIILFEELMLDKAKIVRRVLDKEKVTLRGSIGVGDTESDIPFLKMVDRPICFNPNKKLFNFAKKAGWRVVVERKDVIYELR